MKKAINIILFVLFGVLPCCAGSLLHLYLIDGVEIACDMSKHPQMTFNESALILSTTEGCVGEWEFSGIDSWNFEIVDGIHETKGDNKLISIKDGKLYFSRKIKSQIKIYDVAGKNVSAAEETVGENTVVDTNSLQRGAYILRVGTSSLKFFVK